jgi:predicted ATP-grasp superfamily ATP-dependent carboligase
VSVLRDLGGRGGMGELVDAAEGIRADGLVYGAGLENRPDLVARLAAGRTLLGCAPETLRAVRDPAVLGASLSSAGFAYPRTFSAAQAPVRADRARRWLRKPVRGGGGRGVREWRGGRLADGLVVQERISGLPCSAVAVADGRSAVLLGVSEQLVGRRALGARGFKWCGNVVPPRLPADERRALTRIVQAICAHLAAAFGLRGVFGVDVVWDGARPWVVEVNPRPVASLETIEAVHGVRSFAAHVEACAGRLPPAGETLLAEPAHAAGKAVLYATENVRMPDTHDWPARGIRDVPHAGEPIAAGRPICTLVAIGRSPEAALDDLEARAAALRHELHVGVGVRAVA